MLTPEQIQNLKPGDKLVHEVYFEAKREDHVYCSFSPFPSFDRKSFTIAPCCLSLPSEIVNPKSKIQNQYAPCRKFKKGDKVRVVECKGRRTGYDKKIYKVCEDEEESGRYIKLSLDGYIGHFTVDAAYLELVTPVEELETYYVEEQDFCYVVGKRQEAPEMEYIAGFSKNRHPNAKAAAEAECKRLNEEWRKEQK